MSGYFKKRRHSNPPTAWIYSGVSSKIQAKKDKISPAIQERECRALAEQKGWIVTKVLTVPGHSRSDTNFDEVNAEMLSKTPPITGYDELRKAMEDMAYAPDYIVFYSGDRLGRSQSILTYIIETLVRRGTHFYSLHDGKDIDRDNFRDYISRQGERAARGIDELVIRRRNTMLEYVQRGLPTTSKIPFTHKRVRDHNSGRTVGLKVDEAARVVMMRAAGLVLEGVGWPSMLRVMIERYGEDWANGCKLSNPSFRKLFHGPMTWGHNAMNYRNGEALYGSELWCLGPGEAIAPPEYTTVAYNVMEPVFTGEFAEAIKAELRRRSLHIRGKVTPRTTYFLRGLLICGECRTPLTIQRRTLKTGRTQNGCLCSVHNYNRKRISTKQCSQRKWYNEQRLQAFAREIVTLYLQNAVPRVRREMVDPADIAAGERAVGELTGRLQRLVNLQGLAESYEAAMAYTAEIKSVSQALTNTKRLLSDMHARASASGGADISETALAALREMGEEWLWSLPEYQQNQWLHRIMGDARIVAKDGELRFQPPGDAIF